jgi:TRAP-type C4-dicarboxylate transport system substrate-binding protein
MRLDTYDDTGTPSTPYILEFANQVTTLSGGSLTIEPTYAAGTEQEVIQNELMGGYDLGLVASRAWDTESVTSFQALQAPFLITNDALAIAVATSDNARQILVIETNEGPGFATYSFSLHFEGDKLTLEIPGLGCFEASPERKTG